MINVILLFLAISLGKVYTISFGNLQYNIQAVELLLVFYSLIVFLKMKQKNMKFNFSKNESYFYIAWFLVFFYSILTFFWTDQGVSVLSGSLSLFYGLLAFFVSSYYFNTNRNALLNGNRILIISLLIQVSINIFLGLQAVEIGFYGIKHNSTTLLGNSNYIAFFFSFVMIMELISKQKKWQLYLLLSVTGVVLTLSRGTIFSIIFVLLLYFIFACSNKNIKAFNAILNILLAVTIFSFLLFYTTPGIEFRKALEEGLQTSSFQVRLDSWSFAFTQIIDNPLGNGIYWRNDSHNLILSSFKFLGIIFGVLYLTLLMLPIQILIHQKIKLMSRNLLALILAYISIFIHAMVEVFYFDTVSIIWVAFIFTAIFKVLKDEKNIDSNRKIHPNNLPIQKLVSIY